MIKSVSYDQLNPVSFLDRSSSVYPDKQAVIYKQHRYTYSEFGDRVNQLANAFSADLCLNFSCFKRIFVANN